MVVPASVLRVAGISFGLFCVALSGAEAQRLRSSIGCDKIENIPKNISLAELERLCFGTNDPPTQAPQPVPVSQPQPPPQQPQPPPLVVPPLVNPTPQPQPPPLVVPPLATPAPVPVPPVQPQPVAIPRPPPPERRFTLIEGRDIDGQDYDRRVNVELRQCMVACRDDERCRAFAYDKWNRYCFLKDNNPGVFRREPKAFVAVNSTAAPQIDFSRETIIQKFSGMVFQDKGYDSTVVRRYEDCAALCERQDRCEVFTYFTPTRTCRLIEKPGEPFTKQPNVISGIKRQLPR